MKLKLILIAFLGCFTVSLQAQNLVSTDQWYKLENGTNKFKIATYGQKKVGDIMVAISRIKTGGHWQFISKGNGLYQIKNRDSKMYLANFGSTLTGSQLKQTNNPGGGALWRLKKGQGGYIQIINNASNMYVSLKGTRDGGGIVQTSRMTSQTMWLPVAIGPISGGTSSATTNASKYPSSKNKSAFKPTHGGRVYSASVRYTDQIGIVGPKPKVGQKIYFFKQNVSANTTGISFDPKDPSIGGQTFTVIAVEPKIKLDRPMPNMRNSNNSNFLMVVEVY